MYTSGLFQTVTYKLYETEKEEKLWLFANCGPVLLMHAQTLLCGSLEGDERLEVFLVLF